MSCTRVLLIDVNAPCRYYNTTERMTGLFVKITNEMIRNCRCAVYAIDLCNFLPQPFLHVPLFVKTSVFSVRFM